MAENPLFLVTDSQTRLNELLAFAKEICAQASSRPMHELEGEIADWHYRRHVWIKGFSDFTGVTVRPFWRDGRATPPLPPKYPRRPYRYDI